MIREFLADTRLAAFPLAAFILFFTTFMAVLAAIVVGIARRHSFDHVASLPLEADAPEGGSR